MKNLIFGLFILSLASCANVEEINAVVIKDCSGTYLRQNNVDFLVCNTEDFEMYEGGERINVKFKDIYQCKDTTTKCIWYHPYAKSVKVKKILVDEGE
jgi:hypothetical protein